FADLEREYGKKLESLGRRWQGKREKRGAIVAVGGAGSGSTTLEECWTGVTNMLVHMSRSHHQLSETLVTHLTDPLKTLHSRTDDSRKTCLVFASRMQSEKENCFAEVERCRKRYEASCLAVELAKGRFERCGDDKQREKHKRCWHTEIVDLQNAKTSYLLALKAVNACKASYVELDLPEVLGGLFDLAEDTEMRMQRYLETFVKSIEACSEGVKVACNSGLQSVEALTPKKDTATFVSAHPETSPSHPPLPPWDTNPYRLVSPPVEFVPTPIWKDPPTFPSDEHAKIYMLNIHHRLHTQQRKLAVQLAHSTKSLEGLETLQRSYESNPKMTPESVLEVREKVWEAKRECWALQAGARGLELQMRVLEECLGSAVVGKGGFHEFKASAFAIPVTCEYCRFVIWGGAKQG
ncbi:hypothetical protein HDV05_001479, partial [Chytridiales sp. JEL 0842]